MVAGRDVDGYSLLRHLWGTTASLLSRRHRLYRGRRMGQSSPLRACKRDVPAASISASAEATTKQPAEWRKLPFVSVQASATDAFDPYNWVGIRSPCSSSLVLREEPFSRAAKKCRCDYYLFETARPQLGRCSTRRVDNSKSVQAPSSDEPGSSQPYVLTGA